MPREMTQWRFRNIDKTEVSTLRVGCKYFLLGMRRRQDGYIVSVFRKRRGPMPPVSWFATLTRTALECGEYDPHADTRQS